MTFRFHGTKMCAGGKVVVKGETQEEATKLLLSHSTFYTFDKVEQVHVDPLLGD